MESVSRRIQKHIFFEWAKSIQKRLNYEYESSNSIFTHGTIIGAVREAIIKDILRNFLPASTQIGTGQIIDSDGKASRQIDIVIAKNDVPVFKFPGEISAFLYETVLATVEVKSMLYRDKLQEALDNCKSVKSLTYLLNIRTKGSQIFKEAFDWIESCGGLDEVDKKLLQLDISNLVDCSDDVWQVLHIARYWLHWSRGDFRSREMFERLKPDLLKAGADFDLFCNLLTHLLKQSNSQHVLLNCFDKAESIKDEFFEEIFNCLIREKVPPATFVLAYGGYENLNAMVEEVRNWFQQNVEDNDWFLLPKVIMNHKMVMYRHYNEYHCHTFDFPVLMFMNGICDVLSREMTFQASMNIRTGITEYFDLGRILGKDHPRNAASFLVWSIPFDGSSIGELITPNQKS